MDWQLIRTELNKQRVTSFRTAQQIYQHGASSRPVAELILDEPLPGTIPARTKVLGKAYNGGWTPIVSGRLHSEAKKGTSVLQVMYDIRDDLDDYVGCLVGENPNPVTDQCK